MNAAQAVFVDRDSTLATAARTWCVALAGAIAGALLATVAPAALGQARDAVESTLGALEPAALPAHVVKGPPLSKEWRWSPPGVNVDSMYAQRR